VTGTREQMKGMPRWLWMDADAVVRDGLAAVARGESVRVSGRINRAIKRLFELLPDRLSQALIARGGKEFRDSA
jgi:short-subunit dehydrogenase